jgi:hypothetical protein
VLAVLPKIDTEPSDTGGGRRTSSSIVGQTLLTAAEIPATIDWPGTGDQ